MNIAIIGSNCLVDLMIQRFSSQPNIENICTYNLPDTMVHPKVINSRISNELRSLGPDGFKKYWLQAATDMQTKNLDLIISTNLMPQLWKEFYDRLTDSQIPILISPPEAAWIEWSKAKSKSLFKELKIPTPDYEVLSYNLVLDNFKNFSRPYVLKYDQDYREGLQTIVITDDNVNEQYDVFLKYGNIKISKLSPTSSDIIFVKEQFVEGKEYSYHVLCNGRDCIFLGAARDYKKRYENDIGHNTGGMGSYSPVDYVDHSVIEYAKKIIRYLNVQDIKYIGIMYLGIMVDHSNNHLLLEVNTRFGDPEFSSILPTIDTDIIEVFLDAALGKDIKAIKFNNSIGLSLRLINKEYGLTRKSAALPSFTDIPNDISVANSDGYINFGPMLTTIKDTLHESACTIHSYIQTSDLADYTYRKDIGFYK